MIPKFYSLKWSFLLLLFCTLSCVDKEVEQEVVIPSEFAVETGDSQIPYFIVYTKGKEIENEPKISAQMGIYEKRNQVLSQPIGIEYRGSTSFRLSDKKSYGIELWDAAGKDVNKSILGLPSEGDWIFMGDVFRASNQTIFDPTMLFHYVGYKYYEKMGRYASRTKFIELQINNDYKGLYILMEKLKRGKDRINIQSLLPTQNDQQSVTGGYILKIDKTAGGDLGITNQPLSYFDNNWNDDATYNANISFRSKYDINRQILTSAPFGPPYHPQQYLETYFLYEYPKARDISPLQKTYIQNYIHQFETALINDDFTTNVRTYTDYIDLDSFVDFLIINELCGNIDGYRLSTYLHKDRGQKLKMGPIWDLNIGYHRGGRVPSTDWIFNYNKYVPRDAWMVPFWWPRLMEDPIFQQALKTRWQKLRQSELSNASVLGEVDLAVNYLMSNKAIDRNFNRWKGIQVNYLQETQNLKNWLEKRLTWMDQKISSL
jgi:hypothetical protein